MPSDRQLAQILEAIAKFSRGGRRGLSHGLWRMIGGAFGPLGELVGVVADVFSGNRSPTQKDINDAVAMLHEFGYEITPRGPSTGPPPIAPGHRVGQPRSVNTVSQPGQRPPPLPGRRSTEQPPPLPWNRPGYQPPPLPGKTGRVPPVADPWGPETTIDTRRVTPQFANQEIETPESSNVFSFAYDADVGQLYVTYKAAGPLTNERSRTGYRKRPHVRGPTYAYGGAGRPIPNSLYEQFVTETHSKGMFVWDHLRVRGTVHGHKYPYMLTAGELRDGSIYVPRKATAKGFRVRTVKYVDTPIGSGYQQSQLPQRLFGR